MKLDELIPRTRRYVDTCMKMSREEKDREDRQTRVCWEYLYEIETIQQAAFLSALEIRRQREGC
ncbi:MAG: hypothetical protein WC683_15650 [bacterium]